jgi:outer membrane protein OmpA-like peptidoglycan-associated protein
MDVDTWNAVVHVAAVVAGVVFGSAAIGTACWVWLKKQTFAYGGSVLCAAGVTLLGLSIWHSAEFGVAGTGPGFKMQAALQEEVRKITASAIQERAELLASAEKAIAAAKSAAAAANAAAAAQAAKPAGEASRAAVTEPPATTQGMKLPSGAVSMADRSLLQNPSAQRLVDLLTADGHPVNVQGIAPPATKTGLRAAAAQADRPASLNIDFAFKSAELTPAAEETLRALAEALGSAQLGHASFSIVGHTGAEGNAGDAQKLSESRAIVVKIYLIKHGIASRRLKARGVGREALLDPANPLSEVNRRVEIINLGATAP